MSQFPERIWLNGCSPEWHTTWEVPGDNVQYVRADLVSGSPTADVERLQKRVGELEEAAKALGVVIQNFQEIDDRGIVKVEFTREIADTLWIIHNKALSPTTTGYVGDGAPVQKTDAFGVVEDETL